jgi:hypothetical protein
MESGQVAPHVAAAMPEAEGHPQNSVGAGVAVTPPSLSFAVTAELMAAEFHPCCAA